MADLYESGPMDRAMLELVSVRALHPFGLGDTLVEVGTVVTVSRSRADYLVFLQLAEWI